MADPITPDPTSVPGNGRFAELLALGEASLRRLADSTRQLQDTLNRTTPASESSPAAGASISSAQQTQAYDALRRIKAGIFQMRDLFQEVRDAGGVNRGKMRLLKKCFRQGGSVKSAVKTVYPVVEESARQTLHNTENYLRKHPLKGLLACVGVGLLLGVLLAR